MHEEHFMGVELIKKEEPKKIVTTCLLINYNIYLFFQSA